MANKKISELPASGALTGAELIETVQGGINKQTTTQDIANLGGGGGTWGSITGTLSAQTDLQTALDGKTDEAITAVPITDASTMDITGPKHTLSTSSATRTFTQSWAGDFTIIIVTLSATTSTFTFPAGALCVSEGVATGNNTLALSGVSGDKYYISISKFGSAYYVVSKNFGQ